ncbi:putative cytosine/adenosine deaminase [Anaplasma centrale str. Israel]|uniref:tRNA-specific adenosine deaminase n=1 Tax=Anaplasma centrale (strain Israel) TaxID=574556 RepID=D1AU69_ANACI|nr:nucleoside deaminase [Anaplasma centrale]ACZ49097.1 putative cytosine/adenosine deaminase [Anaplasma centrale str. Israel]
MNMLPESPYMRLAMLEAVSSPAEVPVGAIVVDERGVVISSRHNLTLRNSDPTAHAEMLAIREACLHFSTHVLNNCDMYVTLEPCAMCAYAISLSRIRRLYFGAYNVKCGGVEHGARVFRFCNHIPEVYGGFLERENAEILKNFFQKLRKHRCQP